MQALVQLREQANGDAVMLLESDSDSDDDAVALISSRTGTSPSLGVAVTFQCVSTHSIAHTAAARHVAALMRSRLPHKPQFPLQPNDPPSLCLSLIHI